VLLAPAIAAVITAELSGQQQGLFSPFASDAGFRTGVASMEEQIIGQGAKHLTSMLLEPGGHLPYERQRELEATAVVIPPRHADGG
jgi:glycine oxidase